MPNPDNFLVMTYNATGLNADVTRGDREYQRHVLLLGGAVKHGVSVVGVQEPHGKLWHDYTSIHRTAELRSFHFMRTLNPGGGGASATYWSDVWEHISSFSLSPRLMFVYLRHNFGSKFFFMVGHLHHLPTLRKEQWLLLKQIIKNFEGHCSSPNARPTLRSSAPNMFRCSLKYSFGRRDILVNLIRYTVPLRLCYPPVWWRPLFLKRADAMGVDALLRAALSVPLPPVPEPVAKNLYVARK